MTGPKSVRIRRPTPPPHPQPGVFSTDVAVRWILARRGVDLAAIVLGPVPPRTSRHRWKLIPRHLPMPDGHPLDVAARSASPIALIMAPCPLDGSATNGVTVFGAMESDGALWVPQVVVQGVVLPASAIAAAPGRLLGGYLSHPALGTLADARVARIDTHGKGPSARIHIRLEPERIVHDVYDPTRSGHGPQGRTSP